MSSKDEQERIPLESQPDVIKNYPPLQLPEGVTASDIVNRTVASGLRVVHFDCRENPSDPIQHEHPTMKAAKRYLKSVTESQGEDTDDASA
jgi:hypothetical protein